MKGSALRIPGFHERPKARAPAAARPAPPRSVRVVCRFRPFAEGAEGDADDDDGVSFELTPHAVHDVSSSHEEQIYGRFDAVLGDEATPRGKLARTSICRHSRFI